MSEEEPTAPLTPDALLSLPVSIDAITAGTAEFTIVASEDQRARIARWLDVPSVNLLSGDFEVSAENDGVRVAGRLVAELGRMCVVSLEAMTETINEAFVIRFLRDFDEEFAAADDSDDYLEALVSNSIDLGSVLVEHLSLSISAYPKRLGAVAAAPQTPDTESPFAILRGVAKPAGEDV